MTHDEAPFPVAPVDPVALQREAERLGRRTPRGEALAAALRLLTASIDLTTLEGNDTAEVVQRLCRRAAAPHPRGELPPVAAVCVSPPFVAAAREQLEGTGVRVAAVAGAFPSAHSFLAVRLAEIAATVEAGAHEVDVVLDRGALLSGRDGQVRDELRACREAAGDATLKVILETGELGTADAIARACHLALAAGADFLKTSTGKIAPAATPASVLLLLQAAAAHERSGGHAAGVKAAGGVRTTGQALALLQLAAAMPGPAWRTPARFRIGASALLDDVVRHWDALARAGWP